MSRKVTIKSLATNSANRPGKISSLRLVGGGWWNKLKFTRDERGFREVRQRDRLRAKKSVLMFAASVHPMSHIL